MIIKKEKIFFITLIILFLLYLIFQMRYVFYGPRLEYNYSHNSLVNDDSIIFTGKAEDLKNLFINEEEIFLDLEGNFSKEIYLYEGKNNVILEYKDTFNNEKREEIVVYKQKNSNENI